MAFTPDSHKNFAYSTVAVAPSPASTGTSLQVQVGDGSKFPTAPFNAVVWPAPVGTMPLTTNAEIVRVTAISTDTFTITRAQESSSARSIQVGDQIMNGVTNKAFTDIENALAANNEAYVTIGNTSGLSAERALTGTTNQVTVTDNGANSTAVLSLPQNIHTGASPTFAGLTLNGAGSVTATSTTTAAVTSSAWNVILSATPASSSSSAFVALSFTANTTAGSFINNNITGVLGQVINYSTSGNVKLARGLAAVIVADAVGGNITDVYTIHSVAPSTASGGTFTNVYGLYIDSITQGSTLNYAIYSAGGKSYHAGNFGINTTTINTQLTVYNANESTTLTNFTQALTNAGVNIVTDFTANAYTPGIFWSTQDNNATKPKGGIWLFETGSGTWMYFGTSTAYATGIDNNGFTLDPAGRIVITEVASDPSAANLTSGSNVEDKAGIYMKNDKLVIAYNRSGTVTYLTVPLDGATATWTQGTTAP